MKSKLTYLLLFICVAAVQAQVKNFDLEKANCQLFNRNLYAYGVANQNKKTQVYVYKLSFSLDILDSVAIDLGKTTAEEFLQLQSDTLHGYLNIYIQKKNNKACSVFRFNSGFKLIAQLDGVDVARLNNREMFGNSLYYQHQHVYSIKTEPDSSGKQFYLNKHTLKSELENFDYRFVWQFPFERKNIHSAHIFYADKDYVLLFVTIAESIKAGQWVLKIDAENGRLMKATKINDKGEKDSYLFGNSFADQQDKSHHLTGQKFTEAQYSPHPAKLAISNLPACTVFYLKIDSLGELVLKQDFNLPINAVKSGTKKTNTSYLLRFPDFSKNVSGGWNLTTDTYKSQNTELCYHYVNTSVLHFKPEEDKLVLEKSAVSSHTLLEQYLETADKLDMNGKLCVDSLSLFENLFYKPLTLPVKELFKLDSAKNPVWVLSKHLLKKNNVNFSLLAPDKKSYKITSIGDITESLNPLLIGLSESYFLISSQTAEGKFQLKQYNW